MFEVENSPFFNLLPVCISVTLMHHSPMLETK